jgi:hypothetical protein
VKRIPLLLVSLLLVAAACGDDGTTATADAPEPPADGLVIQVARAGGFVTPEMTFANLPSVSVYADGRVLAPGATIMIYPGPALVPLQETTISDAEVARLLELADELGLTGEPLDYGQPPVADAPDTIVTITTVSGSTEQRATALAEVDPADASLSDDQREARRRLQELVEAVEGQASDGSPASAYEPDAYVARATAEEPQVDQGAEEPQPRFVEWPVDLLEPAQIGDCTMFAADAADALEALFRDADQLTYFTDADGATWRVTVRPVLPHESGCDDVLR